MTVFSFYTWSLESENNNRVQFLQFVTPINNDNIIQFVYLGTPINNYNKVDFMYLVTQSVMIIV